MLTKKEYKNGDFLDADDLNDMQDAIIEAQTDAAKKADAENSSGGFEGGDTATADTGAAVGFNAKAEILDDTYGGGVAAGENSHVVGSGAAIGSGAEATNGGVALGRNASTESGASIGSEAQSTNGFAGGYSAKSTGMGSASGATASTFHGGAVGYAAESSTGGAVGNVAKATTGGAVGSEASETGGGGAIGYSAHSTTGGAIGYKANCNGVDCIQLGTGTNGNEKTLQVYDKQITDSSGNLVDVGALSDLSTTAKGTIVSAINELAKATSEYAFTEITAEDIEALLA